MTQSAAHRSVAGATFARVSTPAPTQAAKAERFLALHHGDTPLLTTKGRKVLIRGSSLLLQDLAA